MRVKRSAGELLRPVASLVLVAIALLACGCNTAPRVKASSDITVPAGGVLLKGAGATFPSLLYKSWFASYQKAHPQTVIAYEAVGSGEGVRRFVGATADPDEKVDFGASDAAMTDEQIAQVQAGARLVPMTAGAVAIAYNLPKLDGDLRLSRNVLAGIFEGEIKNWDDPQIAKDNPGVHLPKLTIATVVRQESSGTTYAFSKHLDAISPAWRARFGPATVINWPGNAIRAKGNEGVASAIQKAEGSIGYVGYEFAHELGLRKALVENKSGRFVAPSAETASAALASVQMPGNLRVFLPDPEGDGSYPIVTMSWILLYDSYPDARKAGIVKDLFAWCLGEGQNEAKNLGYVPLPATVSNKSLENLQQVH